MNNLLKDLTEEIIGAFSLGVVAIISIVVLSSIGEITGQNEIIKSVIQGILIIAFGIGIPVGIIALIKWLGGLSNERFY
mgnify:CR=1 FL=1